MLPQIVVNIYDAILERFHVHVDSKLVVDIHDMTEYMNNIHKINQHKIRSNM